MRLSSCVYLLPRMSRRSISEKKSKKLSENYLSKSFSSEQAGRKRTVLLKKIPVSPPGRLCSSTIIIYFVDTPYCFDAFVVALNVSISLYTELYLKFCPTSLMDLSAEFHKQPPEVFCKKGALRNFAKFTGKHLR